MISVTVKMGCGENPSEDLTDDLISSVEMAKIRGRQELLNFLVIPMKRSLALPHTPTIDLGLSPPMVIPELDIYGEHEIQSFSIEITPTTIYDNVEVLQNGGHMLKNICARRYPISDSYAWDSWNTWLSPAEEIAYEAWLIAYGAQIERPTLHLDRFVYDMKGFWKNGEWDMSDPPGGHFPDTWKKPNHVSFSTDSIYHGTERTAHHGAPTWPLWVGGKWSIDGFTYTPSIEMISTTHYFEDIVHYYAENEPSVTIQRPIS